MIAHGCHWRLVRTGATGGLSASARTSDRVGQRRSLDKLILDLNSSVSETYGRRERFAAQPPPKAVGCSDLLGGMTLVSHGVQSLAM